MEVRKQDAERGGIEDQNRDASKFAAHRRWNGGLTRALGHGWWTRRGERSRAAWTCWECFQGRCQGRLLLQRGLVRRTMAPARACPAHPRQRRIEHRLVRVGPADGARVSPDTTRINRILSFYTSVRCLRIS